MGLDMARQLGAMALIMVAFGLHCMGQITPRTLVTQNYFNSLVSATAVNCEGRRFYTYNSFIAAAESAKGFGTTGDDNMRKREVAAFLAHVMHGTGGLCYITETDPKSNYCDPTHTEWPCAPGKKYIGRGPIQLAWNYNYGPVGKALQFDGLKSPETVSEDPIISFQTATWFWFNRDCHNAMVSGRGFADTIKAVNGGECDKRPDQVGDRVMHYTRFCRDFGVDPGPNVSC